MAKHNKLGELGEQLAQTFLKQKKYQILETNWRNGRVEIDIIAKLEDIIVFVEVKTRSTDFFGYPEEAVSKQKQKMMSLGAELYLEQKGYLCEVRFDIISIIYQNNTTNINHIKDAFFLHN